ncbi:hypothetical protein NicSoilB4_28720 [Arthrobacter sp. NicSoilB4]|nr:hypothetical protein NicSoilB4_28720 [Arthrobacter sp. NicSoilB4]
MGNSRSTKSTGPWASVSGVVVTGIPPFCFERTVRRARTKSGRALLGGNHPRRVIPTAGTPCALPDGGHM